MQSLEKKIRGKLSINGKIYPIYEGINTIGRNKEAVINIKEMCISKHHAIITLVNDNLHFISDLKSSNGTFLNKTELVALQLYELNNNACLKFADVEATYQKVTLDDLRASLLNSLPDSEVYTQNFYGSNTQSTDEIKAIQNISGGDQKNSIDSNIPNVLLHEQDTQISIENLQNVSSQMSLNDTLNHFPDDRFDNHNSNVSNYLVTPSDNMMKNSIFEAETQIFDNAKLSLNSSQQDVNIKSQRNLNVLSLESSDKIKPLGKSYNIVTDSQISNLDSSDSEIVRPVKLTKNIFEDSQQDVDHNEVEKKIDNSNDEDDSEDSVEFVSMQKIHKAKRINCLSEKMQIEELNNECEKEQEKVFATDTIIDNHSSVHLARTLSCSSSETDIEHCENKPKNRKKVIVRKRKKFDLNSKAGIKSTSDDESELDENSGRINILMSNSSNTDFDVKSASNDNDLEKEFEIVQKMDDSIPDMNIETNRKSLSLIINETKIEGNETILNTTALEKENNKNQRHSETLNESDIIQATQQCTNNKSSSQNSIENSEESFRLGLTQFMNEEGSMSQEKTISHYTYDLKKRNEALENFTVNNLAQNEMKETQKNDLSEKSEASIDNKNKRKCQVEEDEDLFCLLPPQKVDGRNENKTEDICIEGIQKSRGCEKVSETVLRNSTSIVIETSNMKIMEINDEDIFASQINQQKNTSSNHLESELEYMFATQKLGTAEESIDKINDVILQKEIIENKLPIEDSDLEVLLAPTQKIINSPKKLKSPNLKSTPIENQLEVLFSSPTTSKDTFKTPNSPLVHTLSEKPQKDEVVFSNEIKIKENVISNDDSLKRTKKNARTKKDVDKSITLLESKSRRVRNLVKNSDFEDISVKCLKTRKSLITVSTENLMNKFEQQENNITKSSRSKRCTNSTVTSELKKTKVYGNKKNINQENSSKLKTKTDGIEENNQNSEKNLSKIKTENMKKLSSRKTRSMRKNDSNLNSESASETTDSDITYVPENSNAHGSKLQETKNSYLNKPQLKRKCNSDHQTQPKGRKVSEDSLDSTIIRNKRKQKLKVVFTMMDEPQLESTIKRLGGSVVDSVQSCDVLIAPFLKRSMKLLSAIGHGKPICSIEWIEESKKSDKFLDPWKCLLIDKEAEEKWNFSLEISLQRGMQEKLFDGYIFQLMVKTAADVLKGSIESCGGKIVTRIPKEITNFVIVAAPDFKDKYEKIKKKQRDIIIVEPEAIFDGVLRQEIRFERHILR